MDPANRPILELGPFSEIDQVWIKFMRTLLERAVSLDVDEMDFRIIDNLVISYKKGGNSFPMMTIPAYIFSPIVAEVMRLAGMENGASGGSLRVRWQSELREVAVHINAIHIHLFFRSAENS